MKKRLITLLTVSSLSMATIAGVVALSFSSMKGFDAKGENASDYSFSLTGTDNVLVNGSHSGVFHLSDTENTVDVDYSAYTHFDDTAWGILADGGYFGLADGERVGSLTSVSYHISGGDLTIEFGYVESGKPTYYSSELPADLSSFSFPEGKGYPDTFKVSNGSGETVEIEDMVFFFGCSQTDDHVHVSASGLVRETTDAVHYYQVCDICGNKSEVRFDDYKIKIGTSTDDLVEYTPYNLASYADSSRAGTLDFDYNETLEAGVKRFVLNLSGDNSDKKIRIDTNGNDAQIVINSEEGATINEIKFRGGYGVLVFMGETLTVSEGYIDSEAMYTTVKSPLVISRTSGKSDQGIYLNNGRLNLENDVTISGYNIGININQSATGTKDIKQEKGTLVIDNCNWGIKADNSKYVPLVRILSTVEIKNVRRGIEDCSVQVGDDSHKGSLRIDVLAVSNEGDPSVGIMFKDRDGQDQHKLSFLNGQALFCSTSATYLDTVGIKGRDVGFNSSNPGNYQLKSGFKLGFVNLKYGFDNTGGNTGFTFAFEENVIIDIDGEGKTTDVGDLAWYMSNKPNKVDPTSIPREDDPSQYYANIWNCFGY